MPPTLSFFALIFLLSSFTHAADSAPIASVTGGTIQGRMYGAAAAFKGVPFAQPPVGDLRWREPLPVKPWTGTRDAGTSAPPCAQKALGWNDKFAAASHEDCLYLDVWTSEWPAKPEKAVMVWLHGGGNISGAGGFDPLYDGASLVRRNVVLVIVQYRLGIFGLLAHPDLTAESPHHSSGNYAILDQIAALRWVRQNIAQFGGDPRNVTIFGQSAGSIDASLLMTSPLAYSLFHQVIGQSGAIDPEQPPPTLHDAEVSGSRMAQALKAPAQGALPYLRSLPAAELLKLADMPNSINLDGWAFTASPADVFARGREMRVPMLVGSTAIEVPAGGTREDWKKRITAEPKEIAAKALELYGFNASDPDRADPVYGNLADQFGTDPLRCAIIHQGELHRAAGNTTWEYQFDRAIPPRPKTGHSSDLPYVFGNLYSEGRQGGNFQDADRQLSEMIQAYWTNFAKAGVPNGKNLTVWPMFDKVSRKYLEFTPDGAATVNTNQRGPYCDLYRHRWQH